MRYDRPDEVLREWARPYRTTHPEVWNALEDLAQSVLEIRLRAERDAVDFQEAEICELCEERGSAELEIDRLRKALGVVTAQRDLLARAFQVIKVGFRRLAYEIQAAAEVQP